ncbi:MAG: hypothetical protein U1A04_06080, partial [Moraxellaceae bacterium]|nr:hypothetical protein [Moraxellaceae bacterium]
MNALLNPPRLPVFASLAPDMVEPSIDQLLIEHRQAVEQLAAQDQPSWSSFALPLEALDDKLSAAWAPVSHLNAVMNSEAWRQAYNACTPKLSALSTEMGQHEGLFSAWQRLRDSAEYAGLNVAQQQSIENALRDFRLSGIGLPTEQKQAFAQVSERLSTLTSRFADNVLDAT